ncbi:MAG: protein kinase domain-containing protein [Candidatus Binataceae bacterium]
MRCPSCGQENPEERKQFCGKCGASLSGSAASRVSPPNAHPDHQRVAFGAGRYRVIRLLGEGGNKKVYLCRDTSLDRDVAVAVIKTEGLDHAGRARVRHEARAMAKLGDNPHIVAVHDVGEEAGQPFIVSQYIAGGTLEDLLGRAEGHRLSIDNVLSIATETCEALEYAHSCGIIHRDLKPANIFLTKEGRSKLGDFGLALVAGDTRLTAAGMIVGTANYLPPEVALGKPIDARGDLYSLGATFYEMITGRPPFVGDDLKAIIVQHISAQPVLPSSIAPETPRALDELILKLLKKDPQDRPASAAAVREALRSIAGAPKTSMEMLASTVMIERPDLSTHMAPDGTVTIPFSDIENSTVMNERLGDLKFQEVLHKHNSIIRDQLRAHHGFEVKSMGDGFMIAFSSPHRALECAIGIQRDFAAYNEQPANTPIRVRIGLHNRRGDQGRGRLLRQKRQHGRANRCEGARRHDPGFGGVQGSRGRSHGLPLRSGARRGSQGLLRDSSRVSGCLAAERDHLPDMHETNSRDLAHLPPLLGGIARGRTDTRPSGATENVGARSRR